MKTLANHPVAHARELWRGRGVVARHDGHRRHPDQFVDRRTSRGTRRGAVDVVVTDRTTAGGEINFTRVEPGTDAAAVVDGLLPVFDGGPFPDFLLGTVDAEITGTDGVVTATDYHFTVEAAPGASTMTFNNDSAEQFHHVLLVDFGTNDPEVVAAKLPELLMGGEDAPPPDGLDVSQVDLEFARTPVYGPGASGTFEAPLAAGHTYVALCFISDREGGAPHALQHDMYEVFRV